MLASNSPQEWSLDGGCACSAVRYRMTTRPIVVHCCHCTYCQRESGAAFALNAVIEAARVLTLQGAPEPVVTPSHSGKGQTVWRCPACRVAVWSHYAAAGPAFDFVRVGTLDKAGLVPPDVHIYTSTKQPWVVLPEGTRAVPEFYRPKEVWPPESQARWAAARTA